MERKIIVISGPTASGKTELSTNLAKKLQTEIISADSRQFYKYLDIGTAKPTSHELKSVKHHLISFLYPDEEYNVSMFRRDALEICENLWSRNKIPILAGGSGLYIKAVISGLSKTPEADPEIRNDLLTEMSVHGKDYLYGKLKKVDPVSASSMVPQNWKRVIRALEVFYLTGKRIWEYHVEQNIETDIITSHFLLDWSREVLYSRINTRVNKMITDGLIEEVKRILDLGYNSRNNSLNTVGYKEIILYLDGKVTRESAIELIKRNTRRYAKRQLTWFRKDKSIEWLSIKSSEDLYIFAEKIAMRFNYKDQF